MKKALIIAAIGVGSFLVGLTGLYLMMPKIAPSTVDQTRARLDSLGLMPSPKETAPPRYPAQERRAMTQPQQPQRTVTTPPRRTNDEVPQRPVASIDTPLPAAPGTVRVDSIFVPDTTQFFFVQQARIAALEDSLRGLHATLSDEQARNDKMAATMKDVQEKMTELQGRHVEASTFSSTLTKLEDRDLAAVVRGLDLETLQLIYASATARNQTRLLQAMDADRAARFVRTLVQGEEPPPEQTAPAGDAAGATANNTSQ